MTISQETDNKNKKGRSVERKMGLTMVSKVNYCQTQKSLHIPYFYDMSVEKGLSAILSHFQEPVWPRAVSTKATQGRQVLVNSTEEALSWFKAAGYQDCRISAYPLDADARTSEIAKFVGGGNSHTATPPMIIVMIDLDRSTFKSLQALKLGLSKTLKTIKQKLGDDVNPTVLWSGNGFHVYLPLSSNGVILEDQGIFTDLIDQPSRKFLQFAETFLSCGKSDKAHNSTVSFKNCMLRVPGSINSKNGAQVQLLQLWDDRQRKPEINYLLADFCVYLADQKAQELRQRHWTNGTTNRAKNSGYFKVHTQNEIRWIERLLETSIPDGRKYCVWRILVPYLINRKHVTEQQCFKIVVDWLDKCSELLRLDFVVSYKVKEAIKNVAGFGPAYPDKLKEERPGLYELLVKSRVF